MVLCWCGKSAAHNGLTLNGHAMCSVCFMSFCRRWLLREMASTKWDRPAAWLNHASKVRKNKTAHASVLRSAANIREAYLREGRGVP